jgi:hypothetical protein
MFGEEAKLEMLPRDVRLNQKEVHFFYFILYIHFSVLYCKVLKVNYFNKDHL